MAIELKPGNSFFFEDVTLRKTAPIRGFNLAGKWLGKYRQVVTKEPWYIVTSLSTVKLATDAYSKRFGIIQGINIKRKQVQEYLCRPTEFGRKYARHSTFHIGLWGKNASYPKNN